MSRTVKEIYSEAVRERNKRMELSEFSSDSKMSILNGITWAFAAVVYSFESLLDVFAMDISAAINSRINGTPAYYANALLQYQKGDVLTVREDGLAFGYASTDETKRIITQVSFSESTSDNNLDSKLILKVATGTRGNLSAVSPEDLVMINAYIGQIKFAGTRVEVTSRNGDVLIPCLSVYYDGAVMETEIYDADGHIMPPQKIRRMTHTSSGYIRQSTGKGEEKGLPSFRQAIKLIIDTGCDTGCQQTG